jgi:exodeoxyribonuclease V alpha subunit
VTVAGHAATIAAAEWITASGERLNDCTHGQQFKARFLRVSESGRPYPGASASRARG